MVPVVLDPNTIPFQSTNRCYNDVVYHSYFPRDTHQTVLTPVLSKGPCFDPGCSAISSLVRSGDAIVADGKAVLHLNGTSVNDKLFVACDFLGTTDKCGPPPSVCWLLIDTARVRVETKGAKWRISVDTANVFVVQDLFELNTSHVNFQHTFKPFNGTMEHTYGESSDSYVLLIMLLLWLPLATVLVLLFF